MRKGRWPDLAAYVIGPLQLFACRSRLTKLMKGKCIVANGHGPLPTVTYLRRLRTHALEYLIGALGVTRLEFQPTDGSFRADHPLFFFQILPDPQTVQEQLLTLLEI